MPPRLPCLPDLLINALEAEWRRVTGSKGSGRLSSAELDRAAAALLSLQRGLTGERGLVGVDYMENGEVLGAYLLYYWPASFLQAGRALDRSGFAVRGKVLDLGAGPGPAAAACALRGAESVTALDGSPRALECAGRLASLSGAGFASAEWRSGDGTGRDLRRGIRERAGAGPWDLIVLSHSLNEFFPGSGASGAARADFLDSFSESLTEDGRLLAIEPALLGTSRALIAARDGLLARGWTVEAPCVFSGPCPAYAAGEAQTCHDSFRWSEPYFAKAIADRAKLDRPELKMAWFSLRPPRRGAEAPGPRGADAAVVVSDPMLNKAGRTRYMVCGAAGRFSLSAKLSELPAGCSAFARLSRGTRIRFSGTEDRGNGLGLKAGSLLEIID